MRIVVEPSDYILRNAGDTAMLEVAVTRLVAMWPDARIQILSDEPEHVPAYGPRTEPLPTHGRRLWLSGGLLVGGGETSPLPPSLKLGLERLEGALRRRWPRLFRWLLSWKLRAAGRPAAAHALDTFFDAVAHANLLLVSGMGGITDAFPNYARELLQVLQLAAGGGAVTAMMGQGMGPLEDRALRRLARAVLPYVNFIALREQRASGPLLKALGVPAERVMTTGDDAIELAYAARESNIGQGLGINVRAAAYAGIGYPQARALRSVLQTAARARGAPLIAVPISRVPGEVDVETIQLLTEGYEGIIDGGVTIDSPSKVIAQIRRCRLVVAGSYHAAVFALAQGIPAVGLANSLYYRDKFLGLAAQFEAGCHVVFLHDAAFATRLQEAIELAWEAAARVETDPADGGRPTDHRRSPCLSEGARLGSPTAVGRVGDRVVRYGSLSLTAKTLCGKFWGRVDLARWRDLANFDAAWDERSRIIAGLIPDGSRVIEFGAGRRQLEADLGQRAAYIPADLVSRGPGTVICDLNHRPLPDLRWLQLDGAVFAGVLEYVADVPALPPWLADQVSWCIISYACAASRPRTVQRLREGWGRIRVGWVNAYSEGELEEHFCRSGFLCWEKTIWSTAEGSERIFVFRR